MKVCFQSTHPDCLLEDVRVVGLKYSESFCKENVVAIVTNDKDISIEQEYVICRLRRRCFVQ